MKISLVKKKYIFLHVLSITSPKGFILRVHSLNSSLDWKDCTIQVRKIVYVRNELIVYCCQLIQNPNSKEGVSETQCKLIKLYRN